MLEGVRRETGKEEVVQVHYDEGVAIRIDLESCAGGREAAGEALTEAYIGQPLSREMLLFPDADAVPSAEGNTDRRVISKCLDDPARSQTLACVHPPCITGTGRSHARPQAVKPLLVRMGKARSRSP